MPTSHSYLRSTLITGITCEKCHGPGREHIQRHTAGATPPDSGDDGILNSAHFTRDQKVGLCALCHNGPLEPTSPAFSYLPGMTLERFFKPPRNAPETMPEVHGDQVGLLKRSLCYQKTGTLTCNTCHDEHAKELPAASYDSRCLTCHAAKTCPVTRSRSRSDASGCVGCHMPVLKTNAIVSQTSGQTIKAQLRSHWIRVYSASEIR